MKLLSLPCVCKRGLTLIELAVTVGLTALIGVVIFAVLNNGLELWVRTRTEPPFQDLVLFDDLFRRDFENTFSYPTWDVRGDALGFTFPASECGSLRDDESGPCLGLVRYSFHSKTGTVERIFQNSSDIHTGNAGTVRPVLSGVTAFTFSYEFDDSEKDEFVRSDAWPPVDGKPRDAAWPRVVRIEGSFRRAGKSYDFMRTYEFPSAASR